MFRNSQHDPRVTADLHLKNPFRKKEMLRKFKGNSIKTKQKIKMNINSSRMIFFISLEKKKVGLNVSHHKLAQNYHHSVYFGRFINPNHN